MLGLGNSLIKGGTTGPTIITDGLVLKHNYDAGAVVPVSDGAAYFDGNSDNMQFSTIILDSNGNSSVLFWSKRTEVSANDTIIGNTGSANDSQIRFISDGTMEVESDTTNDTAVITLNSANSYAWHHYAFICTSGTLTAYQDGVSCSVSAAGMSGDTSLNVMGGDGTDGDGSNYAGYICNVGVWTSALTQAQIKSIMNKNYAGLTTGTGSESENLVSWWNLDSVIADYDTNDGLILDNHAGLGPELINLSNSDDYGGTGESGDFVVTGDQTATWTGNDIGNPQTSYEYLGLDLVVPVNALESGKIYKIQLISTNYQGVSSYGFSETGGASDSLRGSGNFNKTETFVSDGNAIRIFAYDSHSFDATISCKEVLGNPGDLT